MEAYVIVSFLGFGLLWMLFIMPMLQNAAWFYTLSPLLAYPVYYLGLILIFTFGLGGVIGFIQHDELDIVATLRSGAGTWIGFSFVADMVAGGFYLGPDGTVLLPLNTGALENSAVDAFVATIWRSILGNGVLTQLNLFGWSMSLWYFLTYPVIVVAGFVIMALLLPTKGFLRAIGEQFGF